MAFNTSNAIQRIYNDLGQTIPTFGQFNATGGSTTTAANSGFPNLESPPESGVFFNNLAIVVRDAGGAGAAPEGEMGLVSDYTDTSGTLTFPALTTAVASGDTIMVAAQDRFPLQQVYFSLNSALSNLGDIPLVDTSLTTASATTEYSIPVAVKRGILKVYYQGRTGNSSDNQWEEVFWKREDPGAAGSAGVLYLPQLPASRTIRIIYMGAHPVVSTYSSYISEYVHPSIVVAASIVELLRWYNNLTGNQDANEYFLYLQKRYEETILPTALAKNPIWKPKMSNKYMSFSTSKPDLPPTPIFTG